MALSHAWNPDQLAAAVAPLLPGMGVEIVEEIDSSNTELMRRGRAGQLAPVLLVAERQTAGRGRLGRPWQSAQQAQESASLTFSLGLPLAPRDWSGLSLAVGVSVAESLDVQRTARLALKWPNDLWIDDRKLGGILIETALPQASIGDAASRWLVIGIGLNLGPRDATGLSTAPAWVQQWLPDASPPTVLQMLVAPLLRDVLAFEAQGFALFAERFAARDALKGREVQLSDGTVGRCEGVGWGGELRVHTENGMQSISSSEVSVRPRAPAA
ncbi:bifunctional biotin--[acetyl-CoA-carboxylase] ligase/biotin operon repressor BirA [soil metagenome]